MSLHDLQIKKFTQMFHYQDSGQDGYIDMNDQLLIGQRAAQLRGYAPDSPEAQAVVAKAREVGSMFIQTMDQDGDGRITLEEWLDFYDQMLAAPREQYLDVINGGVQTTLDMADADGDEQLSLAEYQTFLKIFNVEPPDVPADFARLDLNGDGYISKSELLALIEQWHTSTDPADPGNYMTGPLS